MSSIEQHERELYEHVWTAVDGYGAYSPGETRVEMFREMSGASNNATVLDAGCGSGKGAVALVAAGFRVTMADLTSSGLVDAAQALPFRNVCLWHDLRHVGGTIFGGTFDFAYCCDVLEHVPTAYTMLTVTRLLDVSKKGVFLTVGTNEDGFGLLAGSQLHQTVQSYTWWRDHLRGVGRVIEARDLLSQGAAFFVRRG